MRLEQECFIHVRRPPDGIAIPELEAGQVFVGVRAVEDGVCGREVVHSSANYSCRRELLRNRFRFVFLEGHELHHLCFSFDLNICDQLVFSLDMRISTLSTSSGNGSSQSYGLLFV